MIKSNLQGIFVFLASFALVACSSGEDNVLQNDAPTASAVTIIDDNGGDAVVGDGLTGNYIYADVEGNAEGVSTYRWLRDGRAIGGAIASSYTVITADVGHSITFEVTPVAKEGAAIGDSVTSSAIIVAVLNSAPKASGVSIIDDNGGIALVGDSLTGNYIYRDVDGDAEGISTFRWLRDGVAIAGATASSYTLTTADSGASIAFEVTPVAATGITTGSAVISTGAIVVNNSAPTAINVSITDNNGGTAVVGDNLTGTYIFADVDGDLGDVSSYRWLRGGAPIPGAIALTYSLVADDSGQTITFEVTPIATTGTTNGFPVTSSGITVANSPPIANAGTDKTAQVTDTVALDGSGSSDLDNDPLTYSWSLSSVPATSLAVLSGSTTVSPTFVADVSGTYVVQLIVNDGTVDSAPVTVNISTTNSAPVADAGPAQTPLVGETVTLDGSGSSDVDGDGLTYSWSFTLVPASSGAVLSDSTVVGPTFDIDLPGTYVVQLIVNDGSVDSAPVTVSISTTNSAPIANAGPDQTAQVTDTVTLDGSGSSDVDQDALTYSWSLTSVPASSGAVLSDSTVVGPTFVIDLPGTYVVQLIVNDGTVDSAPVTVNISTTNSAPVADAGPAQTPLVGETVTLDGSGSSDVDGDGLTYSWSLTSVPASSGAVLSDSTVVGPTFDIDLPGTYLVQLIVNDGSVDSAPVTVSISTTNSAPVADAGPAQTPLVGETVTLDGSASNDVDGDGLTYSWSLSSVPATSLAVLSGPTTVSPTFVADVSGTYVVQLIVNDGSVDSAPVTVNISTDNSAPVANAGTDQTVFVTDTVTLDGSASSDVDGDGLTYSWSLSSVPATSLAVLSGPTTVNPTFVADVSGTYVVQLFVNDGSVDSAPVTVNISTTNSAPVADAGPAQTPLVGETVTLDGSASSDVDGDGLTYSWSLSSVPATSLAVLSGPTTVNPTFVADVSGTYVVQLIVNDGSVDSAPVTVNISTDNSAPVANAGTDQTVFVTDTMTLDGSGSSDVDGDGLTYSWSFTSVPASSGAVLSDSTVVGPTFVIDLPGTYVVQLIVNDGTVDSAPVTVSISTTNSAPVANAGPDQTAQVTDTVTLDGSGSSDVDGDSLTYSWILAVPAGSTAALSDTSLVNPTFDIDLPGTYIVQLVVNDGSVDSVADTVSISTINSAPVANAGMDQTVFVTDTVTLDGSGSSDVDGDGLTYSWSLTSVPASSGAVLSDSTVVGPTFDIDLPGTYVVQLIVNDGSVDSAPVTVSISTTNSAPVADAGPAQTPLVGETVTLDGSASNDVDGDGLTYSWSLSSVPATSLAVLSGPTTVTPTFVADVSGTYVVQLIVNDGTVDSAPVTVSISTDNSAPVANAGTDQTVFVTDTVTLDGSGSSDVDGDGLTYSWSLSSVPATSLAVLSGPTTVTPTFVADVSGTYVVQLIVNDGSVDSAPVTVNISTTNSAPVADAGPAQTPLVGETVTLDGSASSDVDGDGLTYSWSLSSVPATSLAVLSGSTTVTPTFVADVSGTYVVQLIVNDGSVDSAPVTVNISTSNSAPVADAGPAQTPLVGETVTLDGSASSDVDGDGLTYSWSLSSVPATSLAVLSGPTTVSPTFVADVSGTYVVQLIVNDGSVDSAPATVNISTTNSAPVADAGPAQTPLVGETVILDGSASNDVDGDGLTYSWSLSSVPATSLAILSGSATVNPTFVADVSGTYVVQLIVNDGSVDSAPVTVNISTDNSAPVANAGTDQTVFVTDTVTLDGSGSSDVDGDGLTYSWSLSSVPATSLAVLSGPTTVNPTFVADVSGTYVVQLIVNDGSVDSAPVTVNISTDNSAPVANAGTDQTVFVTDTVTLDGSASSDVDGDGLTYSWSLSSVPATSLAVLSGPTTVSPTFVADVSGTYVVQLFVNDGSVDSAPATVNISTSNSAPVADAGPAQTPLVGETVTLDGSASSDVDGDGLTYSWSLSSVPATSLAVLSGPTTVSPTFVADVSGTYVVQLIVNDGSVDSAPVTVNISTDNSAPVANAGTNQTVFVTDTVTLDGSGSSDVDGDGLTYSWSITSVPVNSNAVLSNSTAESPTFVADELGTYVVQLIVNDGLLDSAPDTVNILAQ